MKILGYNILKDKDLKKLIKRTDEKIEEELKQIREESYHKYVEMMNAHQNKVDLIRGMCEEENERLKKENKLLRCKNKKYIILRGDDE
jgi:pyruvate-formate lyase-activating enzyme